MKKGKFLILGMLAIALASGLVLVECKTVSKTEDKTSTDNVLPANLQNTQWEKDGYILDFKTDQISITKPGDERFFRVTSVVEYGKIMAFENSNTSETEFCISYSTFSGKELHLYVERGWRGTWTRLPDYYFATEIRQGQYDPGDPFSPVTATINYWSGRTVLIEVGVPFSLVGRNRNGAKLFWTWSSKGETLDDAKETFVWRIKDDGGTGATITGDIINATSPGTVIVTAVVPNGAGEGRNLIRDFVFQVAGPKVTKGDYVVRQFQPGWLLDKYNGKEVNVVIPASLEITIIGRSSFRGSQITSVVIPEGVTEILGSAFVECRNLRTVTLPSSLRIIGNSFRYCERLTTINIPAGVTTIERYAFYNCKNLTEITIPATVTTIGENPFSGCTGLISITVQAVKPPLLGGLWWDGHGKLSKFSAIYVPATSVDAYKNAKVWRWDDFAKFIKPIGR